MLNPFRRQKDNTPEPEPVIEPAASVAPEEMTPESVKKDIANLKSEVYNLEDTLGYAKMRMQMGSDYMEPYNRPYRDEAEYKEAIAMNPLPDDIEREIQQTQDKINDLAALQKSGDLTPENLESIRKGRVTNQRAAQIANYEKESQTPPALSSLSGAGDFEGPGDDGVGARVGGR